MLSQAITCDITKLMLCPALLQCVTNSLLLHTLKWGDIVIPVLQ
jgi:hypothetical protein